MTSRPAPAWLLAAVLALAAPGPVRAQEQTQERTSTQEQAAQGRTSAQERLSLAIAAPEYPVTPGDTYRLSYLPAAAARAGAVTRVAEQVIVRGDYTVDLRAFEALDGRGMRFDDLRRRIVALVESAYPGSNPSLLLTAVGAFEVHLRGAVETAGHVSAWGLGRLSEALADRLTEHASLRDVRVERDGGVEVFDLFRAQRFGVREQDPYLQPGDRICVSRRARSVAISGEVRRPGAYQLLDREGFADLVAFADGFTPRADLSRVRIDSLGGAAGQEPAGRGPGAPQAAAVALFDCDGAPLPPDGGYGADERGSTRYAAWDLALAGDPLRGGDAVVIGSRDELQPTVFFEGAVGSASARITYRYRPGETLFDALLTVRDSVIPGADLTNAVFARRGAPEEPIDLDALLYGGARAGDRRLAPMDRIVIPARRFEVALRGEVVRAQQLVVSPATRLDDVVPEVRTRYTSIRRIEIESADGRPRTYDLFRWRRFGETAHNPLLEPGAAITFRAREREVRLAGEVRRPGTYQLLDGEQLDALIERYGDGLSPDADPSRVTITRQDSGSAPRSIAVDYRAAGDTPLRDRDSVAIHARPVPIVYVEGALSPPTPTTVATTRTTGDVDQLETQTVQELAVIAANTQRRVAPYHRGATAFDVLFPLRGDIRNDADLRAGYVTRGAERLPVDLERLLFTEGRAGDLPLEPYDTIVIPVRPQTITVAGSVHAPGQFPYLPGRAADYYVRRAGGAGAAGDADGVTVTDASGRMKERSAPLAPDDQVFVPAADASFLSRIIAPVAAVGSLALSVVSLILVLTANP